MNILDVIFPRWCVGCGRRLVTGEKFLCLHCLVELPRTSHFNVKSDEPAAFVKYIGEGLTGRIIKAFKYKGKKDLALYCGQLMAQEILHSTSSVEKQRGYFDGIDYIVPVPLTWNRKRKRGYNQSEQLAKGISKVVGIPVCTDLLKRINFNGSQTVLSATRRVENVQGVFALKARDATKYHGKHVLLVDDVITVGATTRACCEVLYNIPNLKVSILGFATPRG